MSDIKNVNQINFDYNGKHYCLEYTLDTIKQMQEAGFSLSDMDEKSAIRIEQLWLGAFFAHHRKAIGDGIAKKLYFEMKGKEELLTALVKMYNNTLANLMPDEDDEGNVEWTATL